MGVLKNAPFIPIFVRTELDRLVKINALVDSGAVVPKQMAAMLGMRESGNLSYSGGVGGTVKVRNSELRVTIQNNKEQYFLTVPAMIIQDPESDVPFLLGRNVFFEHFHITFKHDQKKICLKKVRIPF